MAKTEKTIELNVNASQGEKALAKFGLTVEKIEKEGLQPLNFAIGELEDRLYEMAAAGQTGTKEFQEMASEVGRMKKVIIDTDLQIDAFSQNISQNVGGAIQGVASGFQLAQGAMGAFGASGEAVEEALLKVQSAMAIADGIQGIREGIKSFKALRVAAMNNIVVQKALNLVMSMNPIGIIITAVVGLGAAIAALWSPVKKLMQAFGLAAEESETAAEANERLKKTYDDLSGAIERASNKASKIRAHELKMMELQGATEEELHQKRIENIKKEEQARKTKLELETGMIAIQKKQYKKALEEGDYETAKSIREELNGHREKWKQLQSENGLYLNQIQEQEQEHLNWQKEQRQKEIDEEKAQQKTRYENYKNFLKDREDARRAIEDATLENEQNEAKKRLEEQRIAFERERADTLANERLQQEEKAALIRQLEIQYERERRDLMFQLQVETNDALLPARELETSATADMERQKTKYTQEEVENRKAKKQEELEAEKQLQMQKIAISQGALSAINDLVQAFAGDSEKSQKRAFQINKAVGIANAVINTAQGFTQALASAPPPFNFISAGTVAAAGAAQIATIAKTQFNSSASSGGGSSSGGGAGSVPSASVIQPNFNIVGDTGLNQLAATLGQQGASPIEAYVVAGNVTTAQSLDRNKIETASL